MHRPTHVEQTRGEYVVSSDSARLDAESVHAYLSEDAYWARGIPMATVRRALDGSLCFGLYHRGAQVGLARVVTDRATFAYLCDVYVLPEHRGRGLSKWMMECILAHPDLQEVRRFALVTEDAHGLYEQFGFRVITDPERHMVRRQSVGYGAAAAEAAGAELADPHRRS